MYRTRSSIPYDILHGINYSPNISTMFAYLSYFPPPPPVILGPPPKRLWTCSSRSLSSSCLISDDLNPPSLRQYIPLNSNNQTFPYKNFSHLFETTHSNLKSSSILNFFQNQLTFILLLIIFLTIFIFVILLLLLFLYIQRLRQRQLRSITYNQTNNNNNFELNNNNNFELNNNNNNNDNNKTNKKFYYHLIPHRGRHRKEPITNPNDDNNSIRLTNHDSPVIELKRLSKTSEIHRTIAEEHEEVF